MRMPQLLELVKVKKPIHSIVISSNTDVEGFNAYLGTKSVIHLSEEFVRENTPECVAHVLAHEIVHALGGDEKLAELIANAIQDYRPCRPVKGVRIKSSEKVSVKGKNMPIRPVRPVKTLLKPAAGILIGKGLSKLSKYIEGELERRGIIVPGQPPHKRFDFYFDLATGIGLTVGGLFLRGVWGEILSISGLYQLANMVDYGEEYVATAIATVYTPTYTPYTPTTSPTPTTTTTQTQQAQVKAGEERRVVVSEAYL